MQIRLKTTPKKISDCDNRVKTQIVSCRGSWLSPSPYENKCRYRNVRPHSLPAESHSFVGMARETAAMPPARRRREKKKKERFYIYSDVTHTHPAGTGKTLKGKRKTKADTNDGPRPKQRRGGGEQTDLQNQPTRRDGPNQHRAHT